MNYPPFWSVMWMQMADVRFEIFTSKLKPVYGIRYSTSKGCGVDWTRNMGQKQKTGYFKEIELTCRISGPVNNPYMQFQHS